MEYQPFTFADSGETILIRKVSPFLGQKLQQRFRPPQPPTQRVNYGSDDDPQWQEEENPADPEYQQELSAYYHELETKLAKLYVKLGVKVEWTDEKRQAVEDVRAVLGEEDVELDEDDTVVFVRYIAAGTKEDYEDLVDAITKRSRPTKEGVQQHVEMFPADAQGA